MNFNKTSESLKQAQQSFEKRFDDIFEPKNDFSIA
jgi:hypothetical protein